MGGELCRLCPLLGRQMARSDPPALRPGLSPFRGYAAIFDLARRHSDDELGKLVGIAGAFLHTGTLQIWHWKVGTPPIDMAMKPDGISSTLAV